MPTLRDVLNARPETRVIAAPGVYDIPAVEADYKAVVTNGTPIAAYRGAGRPEAAATIERAVDWYAAEAGVEAIALSTSGAGVRGRGLLTGIVFDDPEAANKIAAEAFRNGLLIETSGPQDEVVKLMPPLTISAEDLARGLDILEASFAPA